MHEAPVQSYRTQASRITTSGSSFHGIQKVWQLSILKEMSKLKDMVFIPFDMSAVRIRMDRFLLVQEESQLNQVLKNPDFWKIQIPKTKPFLSSSYVILDDNVIKKILKVGLNISLNGGNLVSMDRLVDNLTLNAKKYIQASAIRSLEDF